TAVISCTDLQTDGIINAIPTNVVITGDCRTYTSKTQSLIKERMEAICESICKSNEATYEFTYKNSFSPTINWESCHNTADRKSTRLNSSHVSISYAVFCLKKKTNL